MVLDTKTDNNSPNPLTQLQIQKQQQQQLHTPIILALISYLLE